MDLAAEVVLSKSHYCESFGCEGLKRIVLLSLPLPFLTEAILGRPSVTPIHSLLLSSHREQTGAPLSWIIDAQNWEDVLEPSLLPLHPVRDYGPFRFLFHLMHRGIAVSLHFVCSEKIKTWKGEMT